MNQDVLQDKRRGGRGEKQLEPTVATGCWGQRSLTHALLRTCKRRDMKTWEQEATWKVRPDVGAYTRQPSTTQRSQKAAQAKAEVLCDK